MASPALFVAAALSFISLALVAVAMATNYWVRFDSRDSPTAVNPVTINTELGLELKYDLDYFGLWVGCHRAQKFNKISCGYIGSSCWSNICWVRNGENRVCKDARVIPIDNCAAYQATRAMTIIGTLFLIAGSSILVVSVCVTSRNLSSTGAISTIVAAFFLMIAFAVFHGAIFVGDDLQPVAGLGWSFILLIVAWPLALIGGVFGAIGLGPKQMNAEFDEETD